MSSDEKHDESRTKTRVEEADDEAAQEQLDQEEQLLSPEEEKALRMRRGLDEDDDHELEFGVGADDEALEQLARLESFLLDAFQERESGKNYFADEDAADDADAPETDEETKEKIVDALSDEDS